MARSVWSVIVGTLTLRFSTGLTGAMLVYYLAELPKHGGEHVSSITVAVFTASFFAAELVLSPLFGSLADRFGYHRIMQLGSGVRGRGGHPDRDHHEPLAAGRYALAGGRLHGGQRAVHPRLHRDRDDGRRGPAREGGRALRGGDAGRPGGGHRGGRAALDAPPPRGVLRERAHLRRLVGDLSVRGGRPAGGPRRPRARAAHEPGPLPGDPVRGPCLAAGADLDRGQRRHRAVDLPVDLPARQGARPALRRPAPDGRRLAAPGERRAGRRDARLLRRPRLLGQPLQEAAPDHDHLLRARRRRRAGRGGRGDQPRRRPAGRS